MLSPFYRGRSWGSSQYENTVLYGNAGNVMEWNVVSEDKTRAVGMLLQKHVAPAVLTVMWFLLRKMIIKKKKKLESISCLIFEGTNNAHFFSSKEHIIASKDLSQWKRTI